MFHRYPYPHPNAPRKDYLMYLVLNFVATPEEQEEYRTLERNLVEKYWNDEVDRQSKYRNESVERDIAHYKKRIPELRSTIEGLDYANKMQEMLHYMETHRVEAGTTPRLKGFVSGWGD